MLYKIKNFKPMIYTLVFIIYLIIILLMGLYLESSILNNFLFLGFEASASASSAYVNLSTLIRSGISFSAGLVAVFNPCGFALLSVYLSSFINNKNHLVYESTSKKIFNSILITTTISLGFILVFFVFGLLISSGAYTIKNLFSYLGIFISVILLGYGFYVLSGGVIYFYKLNKLSGALESSDQKNFKFYFYYGISYGLTSLSCSLPIFMSIVFSFSNTSAISLLIKDFILFSVGCWVSLLSVSIALLFLKIVLEKIKIFLRIYAFLSSIVLIFSGTYLILYWMSEFRI